MKRLTFILLSSILLFFVGISLVSAVRESLTYDELVHIQEGKNALIHHTFNIDTNNPPFIRELQTIPLLLGVQHFIPSQQTNLQTLPARSITILLGVALLLGVFFFTKKQFGVGTALFSTFVLAFEPTILGNSHYVTQDIGITLFVFISYVMLLSFFQKPSKKILLILGILVGLGLSAKLSFIPYFGLSTLGAFFIVRKEKTFVFFNKHKLLLGGGGLLVLVVLWATYFFTSTVIVKERKDSSRVSEKLLTFAKNRHMVLLQNVILFTKNQPIPLGDYMGVIKNNLLRKNPSCMFMGTEYSKCRWYFMIGNFLLKTPLPLFILFGVGLWYVGMKKKKRRENLLILLPIGVIFFVSGIMGMQPLVRYILPLYPFFVIFAAFGLPLWLKNSKGKLLLTGILLWYVTSSLLSFPHFISYANEFGGYSSSRYKILEDSNLDWGQSLPDVATFHKKFPTLQLHLSYFGRDNGDTYTLMSDKSYGSYKGNEICGFHTIGNKTQKQIILISVSNWWQCGYYKTKEYNKSNIKGQISDSFLIFAK